ncbi:MAG TPA: DNA primase catalytic subunit PriS [Methanotrichaceae archaeon]|nr:DNA primase catalytic subunit PriS [Methanotrichaceae archaeon]
MNTLTRSFLKSKFREYYRHATLAAPPGLESREWGFILFDEPGMRRHKSYFSPGEMADYIRGLVPAHVYHSAAYYERPGAPTMKEKIWKGADLIFDLDADHLRKAPKSYGEMLDLVKKETQKLLDFLLSDFGFSESKVSVVFSGGRGYHIHVRDPRVMSLTSDERREMIDYMTGRGLSIESFIKKLSIEGDCGVDMAYQLRAPSENSPGWGGRINRSIFAFVSHLRSLDEAEAVKMLTSAKGIGTKNATSFYRSIQGSGVLEEIRRGNLDLFKGSSGIWNKLLKDYLDGEVVNMGFNLDEQRGETDEPVTADVKRLIRFPTSLHGGSGFRVTPLTIDAMEDFDPLFDAVVFGDEAVPVLVVKPCSLEMRGESFALGEGPSELPACAAVFLMARGLGELGKALEG